MLPGSGVLSWDVYSTLCVLEKCRDKSVCLADSKRAGGGFPRARVGGRLLRYLLLNFIFTTNFKFLNYLN